MFFTRGVVFPLFLLVGIGAFLLRYDPPKSWRDPYVQLVLLVAIYMAARTAALPGKFDRALVFPFMLTAIIHPCMPFFAQKKHTECQIKTSTL